MKQAWTVAVLVCVLAGCGGAEAPDRQPAPGTKWTVVATSAGDRKITAIKAIREVTGLGLRDAKDLADSVPSVIVSGVSKEEAETVSNKLREAGLVVEVRPE